MGHWSSLAARLRRCQSGAAALEFVIVLPLLLSVLFGLWEFGRIIDAWLIVTNAAREGARYAIETPATNLTDLTNAVRPKVQNYLDKGYGTGNGSRQGLTGDVNINLNDSNYFVIERADVTGPVTVMVTATVDIYAPWAPVLQTSSGTFAVGAIATMRQ